MYGMRKPAAAERPAREGASTAGGHSEWPLLVRGIREGSTAQSLAFKERYRPGVVALLRRQLGAVGLTQLVEEALDGALREIAGGRVTEPGDLVHFLRNILEREMLIRNLDPARSLVALATATDHARLTREAGHIQQTLTGFTAAEQQALCGYYDGDLTAEKAAEVAGLDRDDFRQLRERLYRAVEEAGLRKGPRSAEAPATAPRAMAVNSGA
jgi:hypothetical protein